MLGISKGVMGRYFNVVLKTYIEDARAAKEKLSRTKDTVEIYRSKLCPVMCVTCIAVTYTVNACI